MMKKWTVRFRLAAAVVIYCLFTVVEPAVAWQWDFVLHCLGIKSQDPSSASSSTAADIPSARSRSYQPDLLVIGAGLPRSGTDSLREALEVLGFHAYHAKQVGLEGHNPVWKDLFHQVVNETKDGVQLNRTIDTVITKLAESGYNATTDFPAALVFEEFAQRFPNAKVILSVRDSARQWAESFGSTLGTAMGQSTRPPFNYMMTHLGPFADYFEVKFGAFNFSHPGRRPSDQTLEKLYTEWVERVQRTIEPKQLLIHNSKDGWEPLCQFLSTTDCPTTIPYPWVNTRTVWLRIAAIVAFIADYWPYVMLIPMLGSLCMIQLLLTLCFSRRLQTKEKRD